MDTLTENMTFPCEPATEDELFDTIHGAFYGFNPESKQLWSITAKILPYCIPWPTIHALCILAYKNALFGVKPEGEHLPPGFYINRTGTCLLLIDSDQSVCQACIDRCAKRLNTLMMFNADFPDLELSSLTSLTELMLYECNSLTQLPNLDALENLTRLYLSECSNLTQLPPLDALKNLTELKLPECSNLTQLSPLDALKKLTELNLSWCSSLTQLPSLDDLENLTELNLSGCRSLKQLPDLDALANLTKLDLSMCRNLTQLPNLGPLTNLTELSLFWCSSLTQLPNLGALENLTELTLSRCENLHGLPSGIRCTKSLKRLDLSDMHLQDLPDWLPDIAERISLEYDEAYGKTKSNVYLYKTTVDAIPDMSIFDQPYEVVAEWFKNRSLGRTRPLNEIKVVFLGDGEAGKSHTIARLMGDGGEPVDYTDKSTPGIVIKHKPYTHDGRDFRVHYWDFGGQEIMHSMHRIFLTSRTMYVVLLNARDDTQGDRAHYWLQNIQSFAPDAPVLLVLNKIDQNPKASVDERTLRSKYPGLTQVIRMSALEFSREQFNREFRDVLLKEIVKTGYLEAQWPGSWIQVKERLEAMKSHFILGDEYRQICRECQLDNVEMGMLKYFNELGVSFCFCDEEDYELEDHVILRPDWITNGLYIILFNQLADARNGLIPHKSIYRLLRSAHCSPDIRCTLPHARYDNSDIHYVLGVMRKFDLSFTDGNKNEFIPMLCQQESTVDIAELEQDEQILEFNMEFEYLPENLLHRLMVERHEELDMESAWRRGARFRVDNLGYSAVVLIDVNNTLRFFIRHTDPMHRPNTYLTVLKANVDRIVDKMGLKPPINQLVYKLEGKIGTFDYEELRQAREDHEVSVYSRTWRRRIQIDDILNQSAPDDTEKEMRLLADIRRSCQHIQGEPSYYLTDNGQGLEDLRNRRIRDDLHGWSYHIQDQTQRGRSGGGKGIGELDLLLFNENREPWTAIEALRVSDGTKAPWNKHLDKLLDNYNYFGASFLYLLTYVDTDAERFAKIWKGYQTHIPKYTSGRYTCIDKSFLELKRDCNQSFKAAKCLYFCGGEPVTVYHIFARIPLPNE